MAFSIQSRRTIVTRPRTSHYAEITPYVTKDGSTIRELLHPDHHGVEHQSLAEARIPAGARTLLHRHQRSEELYYIQAGHGVMTLAEQRFEVAPGDSIAIAPGTPHAIENSGKEELVLLCCCSPAYRHDDTELLEDSR